MPRQALVKCIVIFDLLLVHPNIRPAITAVNEVSDDGGECKGLSPPLVAEGCLEKKPRKDA
jgi:hypothetical protein